MSEKDFNICLLYERYSPLLSEKKRMVFELSYYEDLTLSEIAEHTGTTRQGVRELTRRTCEELLRYESLLGLYGKKKNRDARMERLRALARRISDGALREEMLRLTEEQEGEPDV